MGIDYENCASCGDMFPDCNEFYTCHEACGAHYCESCGVGLKKLYGVNEDNELNACTDCDVKKIHERKHKAAKNAVKSVRIFFESSESKDGVELMAKADQLMKDILAKDAFAAQVGSKRRCNHRRCEEQEKQAKRQ